MYRVLFRGLDEFQSFLVFLTKVHTDSVPLCLPFANLK